MYDAFRFLILGTLDLPSIQSSSNNGSFTMDQLIVFRNAWRAFLKAHEATLNAGQKIKVTNPKTIADLSGTAVSEGRPVLEFHFKDGTYWPPKDAN
jgi:hypothetical protein